MCWTSVTEKPRVGCAKTSLRSDPLRSLKYCWQLDFIIGSAIKHGVLPQTVFPKNTTKSPSEGLTARPLLLQTAARPTEPRRRWKRVHPVDHSCREAFIFPAVTWVFRYL